MNLEKVVFGFFILLAATLNFGFVYGDLSNPELHEPWELAAAVAVSLIAAVLKFGDRTHIESTVAREADIGDDCVVGPFAALGPGAVVPSGTRTGPHYAAP